MHLIHIIQLSYGIMGITAYLVVFGTMRALKSTLSRSFCVIYVLTAVINIATWLNSWISLRLRNEESLKFFYNWATENYVIGDTLLLMVTYFYYYQNTCTLLLSFDRFAVIYSITSYTKWWNKLYGIVSISALGACALLNILMILNYSTAKKMLIPNANYPENLKKISADYSRLVAITQLVFGIFTFFVCSILNMFSVRRLMALRRTMNVAKEVSFFLITFCIFLTQALNLIVVVTYAVWVVYANSGTNRFQDNLRAAMYFTCDLFSFGPALYTLFLPGPIRRYVSYKVKKVAEKLIEPSWTSVVHP